MPLVRKLEKQIADDELHDMFEILVFTDNRHRSVGAKRQALLNMAQGEFIAYLDDDDDVSNYYVTNFLEAHCYIKEETDVITFNQKVILNSEEYTLKFMHGHPNNCELSKDDFNIRPPWHVCFWRRDIVKHCTFPDTNYGEDWAWAEQANKKARSSYHIDAFMHTYHYNSEVSRATK